MTAPLTPWQRQVLVAAFRASDGTINRHASRVWVRAPMAVHAAARKGLLTMSRRRDRARLSPAGRALVQQGFDI